MPKKIAVLAATLRMADSKSLAKFQCLILYLSFIIATISEALDTLEAGQVLKDGEVLESSGELFQLKFFKPTFSPNRYLGIQVQGGIDVGSGFIWVANRNQPLLNTTSGVLNLTKDGILMINYDNGLVILNPDHQTANSTGKNCTLTILDSGNLVLRSGEDVIWQSFDYPTDTWVVGMKLGLFGLQTKQPYQRNITSWLSPYAPDSGTFSLGIDPNNTNQLVIWRRGVVYWRSGNWIEDTMQFSYFPLDLFNENRYKFSYVSNQNESYFTLSRSGNLSAWITMNSSGGVDWFMEMGKWQADYRPQSIICNWEVGQNDRKGCSKVNSSGCTNGDNFISQMGFINWTNTDDSKFGIDDCRETCRKACSCTGYTSSKPDGTGCLFSTSEEIQSSTSRNADYFYLKNKVWDRVVKKNKKNNVWKFIDFPIICVTCLVLLISCGFLCCGGKDEKQNQDAGLLIHELRAINAAMNERGNSGGNPEMNGNQDHELPFFNFFTIERATGNFSMENKLGQGGFGPVYKGKFEHGREFAVKRLSRSSGQGVEEFKNEVILISKLQHRNLVRLIGCCIQAEEKLLIYEYLPNKSLDWFLFDDKKRVLLDWRKRFCIIEGIAQGLLYLHKYSRLRIIHRDLKASNILLDDDLHPKISDFGLARIFEDNESRAKTMHIAGTRGYMSPEYAIGGLFSVKSDVFSFGVMVLEIISGKKNAGFYHSDHFLNLLGYAWDLWREEKAVELMDPVLKETKSTEEVIRCVHIGLLCVQEKAADRPIMYDVLSMLNNATMALPVPEQPAFCRVVGSNHAEELIEEKSEFSINDLTLSNVTAR